jgi:hypothetical protein
VSPSLVQKIGKSIFGVHAVFYAKRFSNRLSLMLANNLCCR